MNEIRIFRCKRLAVFLFSCLLCPVSNWPTSAQTAVTPQTLTNSQSLQIELSQDLKKQPSIAQSAENTQAQSEEKPAAEAASGEFDEQAVRLEKLMALTFDRSHSAILAAWAGEKLPVRVDPPDEDAVAPAEAKKEGEQAASDPKAALVAEKTKAIEEELKTFGRAVTLGRWSEVAEYLAKLPPQNQNKIYLHLLTGLAGFPPGERPEAPAVALPQQALSPLDVIGLADAAPKALNQKHLELLSKILSGSVANGYVTGEAVDQVRAGTRRLGGNDPQLRAAAAQLFLDGGVPKSAVEFLPAWPDNDGTISTFGLNLLSKYFDGLYAKEQKPEQLKNSWEVHLELLRRDDLKIAERAAALRRTVEISTILDKQGNLNWLQSSFTEDVNRGIEILSSIGGAASAELATAYANPAQRHALLKMQNAAAEALVKVSPERALEWSKTLTLLAEQWIREGEISRQFGSSDSYDGYNMSYDRYGNFYYREEESDETNKYRGSVIDSRDLLDIKPSAEWVKLIDPALQPRLSVQTANLHLKVGEESKAFPLIEQLAPQQPDIARELVHEFLRAWTSNHDPNSERRRYNPYSYIYGYNSSAEAIPLSRSRQLRNLEDLRNWVNRIRKLPIKEVDESLLASAFTTCHSSAEVFQMKDFEAVFGEIGSLKPETTATIAATMRGNLASVWRQMRNQEANKTKRKEHEVIQEVVRGYQVALEVVGTAREKYRDDWKLMLEEATLLFDFNSYVQVVSPNSKFIEMRDAAFQQFQQAAELYAQAVPSLTLSEQKTDVFDYWFYAALGSTDLGQLSHLNSPDPKQFALISEAIDRLPGEAAETHLARFATKMFARLSAVPPHAKYRFLKGGFEIVDDHPLAWEARKTFDYYNDTVHEIKLVTELDGSNQVGQRPFGVFVKLVHTNEMERESGGFQKYAQNQSQAAYVYNYGRPNEDYRDKFEEGVRTALNENYHVISVTFENPTNMRSRPDRREGWRQTPYAYLMLQTKGPQVDRLPPLQLNLDFTDAAGFVVLPIESPALVLDSHSPTPPARPYRNLAVIQTLDERQVDEGKLLLEVRATATGLVPELEDILDLDFGELVVMRMEDQKSSPTGFVEALDEIAIQSDRSWLIELEAKEGTTIQQFAFPESRADDTKVICQQYQDADLVTANPVVVMATQLEQVDWRQYLWWGAGAGVALLGLILLMVYLLRKPARRSVKAFEMPQEINPFTVLGLLQKIQSQGKLKESQRGELANSIRDVQQFYFAPQNGHPSVQLEEIAQAWLRRVS